MKFYPPGPITPYGARLLLERVEPLILYTTADETVQWALNGGLAPWPGVQEGAILADGISGLHPPFSFVESKGARQAGSTVQATVYDPAEYDMQIELMAAEDPDPSKSAAAIRRVVREWVSSWDPDNPGTLKWITHDMGQWTCTPRLYRSPPERQFHMQARRLRQRYTWTIRNDDAFWRGVDSMCAFTFDVKKGFDTFNRSDSSTLGPQWAQVYNTGSRGLTPITRALKLTPGTPTVTVTKAGAQVVQPQARVLTLTGGAPTVRGVNQKLLPIARVLTLAGGVPVVTRTSTAVQANGLYGTVAPQGNTSHGRAQWFPSGTGANDVINRLIGINEIQTVSINGKLFTGGTWTYVVNGQTATVPFGATPAVFQTAIEGLSNVVPGDVTVTGSVGGPYTVTFGGNLSFQNITTSASGVGLTPGGVATSAVVATTIDGSNGLTLTDNQVITIKFGEMFGFSLIENGYIDIWGRRDSNDFAPTGVRVRLGGGRGPGGAGGVFILSRFNAGVETVMLQQSLKIPTFTGSTVVLTLGTQTTPRQFKLQRDNFTIFNFKETGTGSALGAGFRGVGFGAKASAGSAGQAVPPSIDQFWFGDNGVLNQSGHVQLTNFGDQDAYPRYLVYGPGTFKIADGPGSSNMIQFGPLTDNQIALLSTLPRLRGVVDLSPDQPEQPLNAFQSFVKNLVNLAVNSNTPPLLEWFESLLGIKPPQGELYSLLHGRFTKPVPRKPDGAPPPTQSIAVEIIGGNADSKIIAALTPLRRWPE